MYVQGQRQGLHVQHTLDPTNPYTPPQADNFKAKLHSVKTMLREAGVWAAWGQAGPRYHPGMWPPVTTNFSVGLKVSGVAFPVLVLKNASSVRHRERKGFWGHINMASAANCPVLASR